MDTPAALMLFILVVLVFQFGRVACAVEPDAAGTYVRHRDPAALEIRLGDRLVAEYQFSADNQKPFLCPVLGPDGKGVTKDRPLDHLHHRSVWISYDKVNGHHFWTEREKGTFIRHERFLNIFDEETYPGFVAQTAWVAGGKTVMYDEREFRFRALEGKDYLIDVTVTLKPESGKVTVGKTKEGGLPAVRVADELRVKSGGRVVNSEGGVDEKGTMHKRAKWLDYSGPRPDGSWVGIACLVHPENRGYPPYWFVRDWGWYTANYTLWDEPIVLEPGESFTVRCRLIVHGGDAEKAQIANRHREYLQELGLQGGEEG